MEIRVYDRDMYLQGIIENHSSLLWNRSYGDTGSFEAHFPITEDNARLLKRQNLITFKGSAEAGIIEHVEIFESTDKMEFKVKGRFLPALLDRRLIIGTMNFTGTVEDAMRTIVSNMHALPYIVLGERQGYADTVEFQATYKNVLTYIKKLSQSSAIGFRLRPDFVSRKMFFEVYKGVDRSISQYVNPHVEFSERYNNVEKFVYTENDQLYRNVAYVGGEGEGASRVILQVGDTASSGYDRYETFVDAKDIQRGDLTNAQYQNKVRQRGREKLSEQVISQSVECEVSTENFKYKTDYDIGDIVSVIRKPYGIYGNTRISEITEVYESGQIAINPTFGTPLPVSVDWSDK